MATWAPEQIAETIRTHSPEEAARILAGPPPSSDPGTIRRRAQRGGRVFPVISRSGRAYREDGGRPYGELEPAQQMQADAGHWRVGQAVRRDCLPMTVAVRGRVERIYEVLGWQSDEAGKWVAELGRLLSDRDLQRLYPDYPYRHGDECPTRKGGAYRPEMY